LGFIPATPAEVKTLGWDYIDIIIVTGDAYVDHPSFGAAVIARSLERAGYRVAIIDMPDTADPDAMTVFGKPRLFFGVTSGNIDSMVSKFTAFKKVRNDDPYIPNNIERNRPERAVIFYCNMIKRHYKDVPIVLGGIEASMRRFAHYDFWDDKLRRSIIEDSRADIIVYGMGEKSVVEVARRISAGDDYSTIPGTVFITRNHPVEKDNGGEKNHPGILELPTEEEAMLEKSTYVDFYRQFYLNQYKTLVQKAGTRWIVQYPPYRYSRAELDAVYELPFERMPHPKYTGLIIPAFEMIQNSINSHRGCASGCSFCSIYLHQGKRIVSRSAKSILKEISVLSKFKYFRKHITDIGGPTANMYKAKCRADWKCNRESCLFPDLCGNLILNSGKWIKLLQRVKKSLNYNVTIGSGIRYDIFLRENPEALKIFIKDHISGQLKIAPEHTSASVLKAMRKVPVIPLRKFITFFNEARGDDKTYMIPYLMSNHPGCEKNNMVEMKNEILSLFKFIPKQMQSFIPLPLTISSVQYFTGVDPLSGEKFFVEKNLNGKKCQHEVMQERKTLRR